MNELQEELKKSFPDRESLLYPRGITALYLALRMIREKRGPGEVVIPSTVCPSVALAIQFAGLVPRFCDVNRGSFCMSTSTVEKVITSETRAIMFIYMFGKAFDVEAMVRLARDADVEIIEDVALAVGGTFQGVPLGCFGDYTVLSFNDAKILPGSAGVLLLSGNEEAECIDQYYGRLPQCRSKEVTRELALGFRNLTHGWYALMRSQGLNSAQNWLPQFGDFFRDLFVHRRQLKDSEVATCVQSLRQLPSILAQRRETYLAYESLLDENVQYIRFDANEVCWRLPVLLPNHSKQLQLIDAIREAGILVSNHYFPVSFLWGDEHTVTSREIGLCAVNLWVDDSVSQTDVEKTCQLVNQICHDA